MPPTRKESRIWQGLSVALAIAAFSTWVVSQSSLVDPLVLGMILGLIFGNSFSHTLWEEGMTFSVRNLLPAGIVLLGSRLNFVDAMDLGATALLLSVGVVFAGLAVVLGLQRFWKLEKDFALLLAIGTAICGGTAIVAVAPLIRAKQRDIIMGVAVVTLVGLGGMLLLPLLGKVLNLSQQNYGILAGLTIHQTPQVVASGFAYGDEAGQTATVVKLARVCLLAPMALVLGWWFSGRRNDDSSKSGHRKAWWRYFPAFAIGFLVFALIRTLGLFPQISMTWNIPWMDTQQASFDTPALLKACSSFLLTIGMVGVGYQTRIGQFRTMGMRPLFAAAGSSLIIVGIVLLAIKILF